MLDRMATITLATQTPAGSLTLKLRIIIRDSPRTCQVKKELTGLKVGGEEGNLWCGDAECSRGVRTLACRIRTLANPCGLGAKTRSHECERCAQECARHGHAGEYYWSARARME